ncbi:hypothetical protein BCR34DRAFT_608664 [Clohesyomyces aquaticus]|uniref:Uncharacterized protein n=1 Tax=Clohesyomyces aquaticus TaxID=1231657 RepID=A0A1Y1Y4S1_9PLEO|nr:hypothetical protein BCR34DRAFT_608664 [Clohesyomyces aquaticus]
MVQWTGEKDAILLAGVFEFIDVKFSKELLEHLAYKIGDGCTPKAVNHRLANMKAKGKAAGAAARPTPVTPTKRSATTTNATPKSTGAGTGKGRGRGKKARALENVGDDAEPNSMDDAEDLEKLVTPSKKRGRPKEDANSEKAENSKKIKVDEGVEEEGMGMGVGGDMHDEGFGHEDEDEV